MQVKSKPYSSGNAILTFLFTELTCNRLPQVYWAGPIAGGVAAAYVYLCLASPASLTCAKGEGGEEEGNGAQSQSHETRYEAEVKEEEEKERLTV